MFYIFKNPKTPRELAKICKTPKRVYWWVWFRVKYVTDKKQYGVRDHLPTPEQVLKTKKDDCDGIAILIYATLKILGCKAKLISVHRPMLIYKGVLKAIYAGHMLVTMKEKGTYIHMGNWGWKKTKAIKIKDLCKIIYPTWSYMYYWTLKNNKAVKGTRVIR